MHPPFLFVNASLQWSLVQSRDAATSGLSIETNMAAAVIPVGAGAFAGLYFAKRYFEGGSCKSERSLEGKTVIITGGNTGIGKETAVDLASRGARVIIGCRDLHKGKAAVNEIQERSESRQVFFEELDLASLQSIRKFADNILKSEPRLDILVNNAGVMACPYSKTKDGFEMQLGVNHLGHFMLTHLLLDLLKRSSPSRIVNVSSLAHRLGSGINFKDINSDKSYNRWGAYFQSKLANVLFTRELSKRLEGCGVSVFALHPGSVNTELARHSFNSNFIFTALMYPIQWFVFKSAQQGAQTNIYCAVAEGIEGMSGKYFSDCALCEPSKAAKDDKMAEKLWDVSMEMVGL